MSNAFTIPKTSAIAAKLQKDYAKARPNPKSANVISFPGSNKNLPLKMMESKK